VEQRCHLFARVLIAKEAIEEDEGPYSLVHRPRWSLRPSHQASLWASTLGASSSMGASTSRAALAGILLLGAAGWGIWSRAASWTHLGELPGSAFTFFRSFFCILVFTLVPCFYAAETFPWNLIQAVPGRPPCPSRAPEQEALGSSQ
jgi:hypothetical protein